MSTNTLTTVTGTAYFQIVTNGGYFYVVRDGVYLTDRNGRVRTFITRNAARKRISRERSGNFHA